MCGITGIYTFNEIGRVNLINLQRATEQLTRRGPDATDTWFDDWVGLGHRRLSIIDTSAAGNQPLWSQDKRYAIVYNGEIFNYRELRDSLIKDGFQFHSNTDTEVLLNLYIRDSISCMALLNGFFAFAIYDRETKELVLARDRFGIKPLYVYQDEDKIIFGSEMKSLLHFGIQRNIDLTSLFTYFQFNYLPGSASMMQGVRQLEPGNYLRIDRGGSHQVRYYHDFRKYFLGDYREAQQELSELMQDSVKLRLRSDVPVGTYLSGGIDSSVITLLASKLHPDIQAFSIGFPDQPYFDETSFAKLVANHLNVRHKIIPVTDLDLQNALPEILDYLDEPFADSSAIPAYLLARATSSEVTVALSGDGADEIFSGYNKHRAMYRLQQGGRLDLLLSIAGRLAGSLPRSRYGSLGNLFRKLHKYAQLQSVEKSDQYLFLARLANEVQVSHWLSADILEKLDFDDFYGRLEIFRKQVHPIPMENMLRLDQQIVLPDDMLVKTDRMSMANSLEVRVPFLDYRVVEFANSLPISYKINSSASKRILQDTFRNQLPEKLYRRRKMGFEVPLIQWFRGPLRERIMDEWLGDELIRQQGLFDPAAVTNLRKQIDSVNINDIQAHIWAFIVFQNWWIKYFRTND